MGLAASQHVESSQTKDGTHVPPHWQADSYPPRKSYQSHLEGEPAVLGWGRQSIVAGVGQAVLSFCGLHRDVFPMLGQSYDVVLVIVLLHRDHR